METASATATAKTLMEDGDTADSEDRPEDSSKALGARVIESSSEGTRDPPSAPVSPWNGNSGGSEIPVMAEENGVVSMVIPQEILSDANPLWKSYVVGYFIGDAPHVGSIHASVNRIWVSSKTGPKIDVQFIEKNTVLFRIENAQTKSRVLERNYWHIADVPLVVNEWSPETATLKPDLSSMPMWIDLKQVPSHLFSAKGLKCLARGVGKFVKLHPSTERCVRLDVARILTEVDLNKPLVERIEFQDANGENVFVSISYPWLPPRCNVCQAWGHLGSVCTSQKVKILRPVSGKGKEVVVVSEKTVERNVVGALLQELEEFAVHKSLAEVASSSHRVSLDKEGASKVADAGASSYMQIVVEGSVEGFVFEGEEHQKCSLVDNGPPSQREADGAGEAIVSPSRFNVLSVSEDEECEIEELEEGELVMGDIKAEECRGSKKGGKNSQINGTKNLRRKPVLAKDLKLMEDAYRRKKTFVRKL